MTHLAFNEFVKVMEIPSKLEISFQTAIEISTLQDEQPKKLSDWPMHMLNKIMNLSSRDLLDMPAGIKKAISNEEDMELSIEELILAEYQNSNLIHPMDVFLYLFFSCTAIFRQIFVSHVAKCQLSLPLIAVDPITDSPTFYLFAFETLIKDCYKDRSFSKSFCVVDEELPIISFIRVGECDHSRKSQMINEIIGLNHPYFFNRNCKDSIKKKIFLNGSVEVAWYLPGVLQQQLIDQPLVFLNLRGNSCLYPKQLRFIAKISTLICIFVPYNLSDNLIDKTILDLKICNEDKLLFLLYFSSNNSNNTANNMSNYFGDRKKVSLLKFQNIKRDSELISTKILSALGNVEKFHRSFKDSYELAQQCKLIVDKDDKMINACVSSVQDVLTSSEISSANMSLASIKTRNLPLQNQPWKNWANARRELYSTKTDHMGGDMEEFRKKVHLRMDAAREEQFNLLLNESYHITKFFFQINRKMRFLNIDDEVLFVNSKLLQSELNLKSLEFLPILQEQYKEIFSNKYFNKVGQKDRKKIQEDARKELLIITNCILDSSFGIEHVFRELGQVYECYFYCSSTKQSYIENSLTCDITALPEMLAKLILAGHSFEIMDGDANHVPLEWVTKVLDCLTNIVGVNKKIYVLSILGVQSSGKSTLLNTMFGVNFAVSSGRCTRGVFMQVIPINEDIAHKLHYDYIVLLDTEGLRAPELSGTYSYKHDNELATFVIGLGDLTLVNIKGENLTDVEDILQIAVVAFLRMKLSSRINPKCLFVHQNVGDIQASNNLMFSKCNLVQSLDEMTKVAALHEKKDKYYTQFCDVIEFNPATDVFYFPSLLDGDPPMTRVSTGYSNSAKKLKYTILNLFTSKRRKEFQTFNDWNSKIYKIWESMLKETFAFSYRNILELHCRFELDSALCSWSSNYSQSMLKYKSSIINTLMNTDPDELNEKFEILKNDIIETSEQNEKVNQGKLIENFFEYNQNKNTYGNWKSNTQEHFISVRNKERKRLLSDCEQMVNIQKQKFEIETEFIQYKKDIVSKIVLLFKKFRDENNGESNQSEILFEDEFEKLWSDWISFIRPITVVQPNILSDCQNAILNSHYLQSLSIISDKMQIISKLDNYISIGSSDFLSLSIFNSTTQNYYRATDMKHGNSIFEKLKSFFSTNYFSHTEVSDIFLKHVKILSDEVDQFLHDAIKENNHYTSEFYLVLINFIYKEIEKINKDQKNSAHICIEFSNVFIFDFIFHKCCRAITFLQELQKSFIEKTNLNLRLAQLKSELKVISLDCFKNVRTEHFCANKLANILFCPMKTFLVDKVVQKVLSNFRGDPVNSTIFSSRAALQLTVLKDLAKKLNFGDFISYIKFPIKYLNTWIIHKLEIYPKDEKVLSDIIPWLECEIDTLCKSYRTAIENATLHSENIQLDRWNHWKTVFHSSIIDIISGVQKNHLEILDVYSISNYKNLAQFFLESFQFMIKNHDWQAWLTEVFANNKLPSHTITDHILGCKALCPFCSEPCRLAVGEHEHYCGSFHRPQGINGVHFKDSQIIDTEECTTCIKFKQTFWYLDVLYNYEDYKTINDNFKSWKILADDAIESKYWHWVLFNFQSEFLNYYDVKENQRIQLYSYLTEEDVMKDIEKHYNIFNFKCYA